MQMKRYLRVTLQVIEKLLQLIGLLVVLRAAFPPLKATIPPARAGARSPGDARVAEGLVGWGCDTTQRGAILCVDPFASPGGPGSYSRSETLGGVAGARSPGDPAATSFKTRRLCRIKPRRIAV